jgi:hypothetical protein
MAATLPAMERMDETAGQGSLPGPEPENRLAGLSRLLRGIGAIALLAAASSFLLQHWESGGDVWRYYALLAHTGLLGALGFAWGLKAGDARGARTFLALAAGLVPAHFCILGGLVYSQLSVDAQAVGVARYATWIAPDATSALLAVGLSLAGLGVVTAVAFVALARARAGLLGAAYLAGNALLLVPTRDPSSVAALAGVQLAALAALELVVARREPRLRTLEGSFVRVMLWAPAALMLVRSVLHYDLSALLCAVASAAVALLATALAGEARVPQPARAALRGAALVAIASASAFATAAIGAGALVPDSALLAIGGVLFASVAGAISLAEPSARWSGAYRRIGAGVLVASLAVGLWVFQDVVAAFTCLVGSIALLSYGFVHRQRPILLAGAAGAALALLIHLRAAIELYAFAHWGSLALLGVAVILAAALVERRGAALGAALAVWRARFAAWEQRSYETDRSSSGPSGRVPSTSRNP